MLQTMNSKISVSSESPPTEDFNQEIIQPLSCEPTFSKTSEAATRGVL